MAATTPDPSPTIASGDRGITSWREWWAFAVLAALVRGLVSWRTVVPGRDGASYLWMAERVAAGDVGAAFRTVFHPLYPLLSGAAMHLVPDLTPMRVGQLVTGSMAALAVVPLQALTAFHHGRVAACSTALLYGFGLWFVRIPAECMSEGCFYPAVTLWAWALLGRRERPLLGGLAAAIAYAARPEGMALLVLGALRLRGAARVRHVVAGIVAGAWVPIGYAVFGSGFTLTPKASFNYEVGIGGDASPVHHYLENAWLVPGATFEAIGYFVVPLAAFGIWLCWPRNRKWQQWQRSPTPWLMAPLLLQMFVIPLLRSHLRFQSGFGILLLPFAGVALARIARGRSTRFWIGAVVVALLPDLVRLPQERGGDRRIERELGEWLRPRLHAPDVVVTEMPRLGYFAGQEPGPPRAITRDELLREATDPHARFVVVVAARSHLTTNDLEGLGLHPVPLPDALAAQATLRTILVYER